MERLGALLITGGTPQSGLLPAPTPRSHAQPIANPRSRMRSPILHHKDRFQMPTTSTAAASKEVEQLRAENEALRLALARLQGVSPAEVAFQAESQSAPVEEEWDPSAPSVAQAAQELAGCEDGDLWGRLRGGIRWPSPLERPAFWDRPARDAPLLLGGSRRPVEKDPQPLHVVHLTAELAPIAKVGGLGDVVTGLARACLERGHSVEVMLPFYECLPQDQIEDLEHDCDFDCPKGSRHDGAMHMGALRTSVWRGRIAGVPVLLLRPADWSQCGLFRGGGIYGGSYNELEAYLYFCRACLEYLSQSGRRPHVLHVHEWQTAGAAMLYWEAFAERLQSMRCVLTLHNMDNSGECSQEEFGFSGLPGAMFASVDKALDERTIGHNPERLNLLKGGIIYSNKVTTVSPTYASDALSGGAAGWLSSTLAKPEVRAKFSGVLNGIDSMEWDPATDPQLPASFSATQPCGKALCKQFLQEGLGLEVDPNKPLVACITRLVPQKGIHLIRHAVYRTVQQGGQFVLLGSGHADSDFRAMAEGEFKGHPDAALLIMYSDSLAHLIYAAADIVLVPSMFEPCGLTQLIAMRYGAVPVVRRTGGLADTVKDVDGTPAGAGAAGEAPPNGFTFDGVDEASENTALDRALHYYRDRPAWWAQLSIRNMEVDSTWDTSASSYIDIYNSIAVLS